ncbi:sugar ABC transporter ATP-binding protein [Acetobacter cibinongensis]|uniref:ABC transporter O-antigene exporter ATP-binding protein n=1 Tax=Acetobacter cibinongensis TaxID=146475 RepID=A0A0D6MZP6_9PROT|nr:ABC transporter ATP-binding protein [Acetobacter cibinongensis]GAN59164.1 ABC transporter O-antigene exporter ATP-binding protein [Acetobacter cibinongensis]GBQ19150.1 O-antigen exporter ATP-binding protein [Acetobacter cibinongensis NRIC 0482]GEL59542.1 sugar ABC transporter ATP-binding protein [Acetobacter cibinongensis]
MPQITVQNLDVSFPLYHGNTRSLRKTVRGAFQGRFSQDRRNRVVVQALQNISFTLKPGDRLGLVGRNGAGKTTLLRALAGIYEPVAGSVTIHGTIGTLLDPMLGMNNVLTGRENIHLRGMLAGLTKPQITRVEEDVEAFAQLGSFMDLPVNTYSSGMVVRLSFGLATAIMPDVLLMDEWFMAGDAAFRQHARSRLENLVSKADILVLSSHMSTVVAEWCNRLIWLEDGHIKMDGPTQTVLTAYLGHPVELKNPDQPLPNVAP